MEVSFSVHYVSPDRILLRYVLRHGTLVNGVSLVKTDNWAGDRDRSKRYVSNNEDLLEYDPSKFALATI
jgi:hypothetical protein